MEMTAQDARRQTEGARTWLGVSVAATDTARALVEMQRLARLADVIELRLDLMARFDLAPLLAARPCPVVVTYRPVREGGRFEGDEEARLAVLRQAAALGAEVIDIEWDSFEALGAVAPARRMISRHFFTHMPADFGAQHAALVASGAEIVKLVGMARGQLDVAPVLDVLERTATPTVAIAMGEYGLLTRILAPRFFPGAWLTYAAAAEGQAVAPGQIAIEVLRQRYQAHRLTRSTRVVGYWAQTAHDPPPASAAMGDGVWVPCQCAPGEERAAVRAALSRWISFDEESAG